MAFNFNWSPLTADAEFYKRARDLLTTALNKSPKPPIIVDDILVTEFNLGSVPPELEILEIGDLAKDRFRGIFKMCYSGDAFLTLKTRVQVCFCIVSLSYMPHASTRRPVTTIQLRYKVPNIKHDHYARKHTPCYRFRIVFRSCYEQRHIGPRQVSIAVGCIYWISGASALNAMSMQSGAVLCFDTSACTDRSPTS